MTAFPIYDAHGNNVASLTRNGSGGFSIGDRRSYDAWGVVRAQQSGGDPKLRYCAKLGHKQDDESGLIYMRARYYEPSSGRFVSEDHHRSGLNWFSYASNNPVGYSDSDGNDYLSDIATIVRIRTDPKYLQFWIEKAAENGERITAKDVIRAYMHKLDEIIGELRDNEEMCLKDAQAIESSIKPGETAEDVEQRMEMARVAKSAAGKYSAIGIDALAAREQLDAEMMMVDMIDE